MNEKQDQRSGMERYWDEGFLRSEQDSEAFYALGKLPMVAQKSHFRRMELLNSLRIGELTDKVVVDFGVGPWGFACIYPRLQHCGYAIGLDISKEALRISDQLSRARKHPYGSRFRYVLSDGNRIDLETSSVDVFFAGESIEHVENPAAFLDEVHRILKPGAQLILTTPNADAVLYRARNERYCMSAEHVSLMNYTEVCALLEPRFEIIEAKGFNGSIYRTLDTDCSDEEFSERWVREFEDEPWLATGLVIHARRRGSYSASRYLHASFEHDHPAIRYRGDWQKKVIFGPFEARASAPGEANLAELDFTGNGCLVFFWAHQYSGKVRIDVDGETREQDLYSPVLGILKESFLELASGHHRLLIRPIAGRNRLSRADECLLYKAVTFQVQHL